MRLLDAERVVDAHYKILAVIYAAQIYSAKFSKRSISLCRMPLIQKIMVSPSNVTIVGVGG